MFSLSPFAPENLVSRDKFVRRVPRQATNSPHSVKLNLVLTGRILPAFRDGVHSFNINMKEHISGTITHGWWFRCLWGMRGADVLTVLA